MAGSLPKRSRNMGMSTPSAAPISILQIIAAIMTAAMASEPEMAHAKAAATKLPQSPTRKVTLSSRLTNCQAFDRSEEHTSEIQSLMRISYAVFCLKKKTTYEKHTQTTQ